MKQLLLVLMLLCVLIPVNAKGRGMPPLIYNMKSADTGMDSNDGGNSWKKYSEKHTGYVIIEPNDNNTAFVCPINTWTAKDPNTGKKQKYYEQDDIKTFGFLEGLVGKNTVWIMTYADEEQSLMFSGIVKPVKVVTLLGPATLSLASTITGTEIWFDNEDYFDVGSSKISLSYNSLLTTHTYSNGIDTGEDAVAYVISYLANMNYQPGSD